MNFLFLLSLFCLTAVSVAVNADGYNCQAPIKLAPPDDLSRTVYWPSMWNDSMPPIQMASQQDCVWQVTVPDGLFATVVFYKNAPPAVGFDVTFANGRIEGIDNNDQNPYIFTSPLFKLNLHKSSKNGQFSFKVNWSKYPDSPTNEVRVRRDLPPVTPALNSAFTFIADTNVSLVGFSLKNQSHYPLLRQSAVFDGESSSAAFLGNFYQILKSGTSMISSGKTLTVYTFSLDKQFDYTLYMVQDASHDPRIPYYQGVNCNSETDCRLTINALTGPSVLVTSGNTSEFLKDIGPLSDGITLKIFEGVIDDDNLMTTLTNVNYQNRLPMELKNTIRQYLLSHNRLDIELSYDATDAKWGKMYEGRKGFIHSHYYGYYSTHQDTNETFVSSVPLFFNYFVRDADFMEGSNIALKVAVFNGGQLVSSSTYTSNDMLPTTTVSIQGDTYNVEYVTNGASTQGFRIDFSVTATAYTPGTTRVPSTVTSTSTSLTTSSSVTKTSSTVSTTSKQKDASTTASTTVPSSSPKLSSSTVSTTDLSSSPTSAGRLESTTKYSATHFPFLILIMTWILISTSE